MPDLTSDSSNKYVIGVDYGTLSGVNLRTIHIHFQLVVVVLTTITVLMLLQETTKVTDLVMVVLLVVHNLD